MRGPLAVNMSSINENTHVNMEPRLQRSSSIVSHSKMTGRIFLERRRSMVALEELGQSAFNPGVGVPIPKRRPSCCYTSLTPASPTYVFPYHPYSSQSPTSRLPESQGNIWPTSSTRRRVKPLRSSIAPQASKPPPFRRAPAESTSEFLSPPMGAPLQPGTFIDASSYECIPDSPAKHWLQGFTQTTIPTPAPDDEGQEIGPYIIGRQIGIGGFSVVKEALTFHNGEKVQHAVKIVRKNVTSDELGNEKLQSQFDHEVSLWRCLSNPFIMPLFSVIETPYATWAFTELFCGGTLYDALTVHQQGLPPMLALKYAYQLASALRYLHQDVRVVHRDVKLENCVIDGSWTEGGNLKLCDFGLADFLPGDDTPLPREKFLTPQSFENGPSSAKEEETIVGGSLPYAAPEQLRSRRPLLDPALDMWSYGAVLHALTIGELPFNDALPGRLRDLILEGRWDKFRFIGRVDPEVSEVVINSLRMDSSLRWSAVDVLNSQWVSLYPNSVDET